MEKLLRLAGSRARWERVSLARTHGPNSFSSWMMSVVPSSENCAPRRPLNVCTDFLVCAVRLLSRPIFWHGFNAPHVAGVMQLHTQQPNLLVLSEGDAGHNLGS